MPALRSLWLGEQVRATVERAVEEAKKSAEPSQEKAFWTDIYYKGTNPMWLRGRERDEAHHYQESDLLPTAPGTAWTSLLRICRS
ncbi:hypothetical protein AAT19DRAFT_13631 [Rhodotorula toruloides]|uniref:Uncharacterized protein n=1 Tax=Rhodotorula toruloides TaxID=5286 RepID=A0A2T0AC72_RHOTO|nr:hypothetical protein AAT19DRAFT_13631 [Rhodotorula toruloides]